MFLLRGRVAVGTRGRRGVGQGIALAPGGAGATVYVTRPSDGGGTTARLPRTVPDTGGAGTPRGGGRGPAPRQPRGRPPPNRPPHPHPQVVPRHLHRVPLRPARHPPRPPPPRPPRRTDMGKAPFYPLAAQPLQALAFGPAHPPPVVAVGPL